MTHTADERAIAVVHTRECAQPVTTRTGEKTYKRSDPFTAEHILDIVAADWLFKRNPRILIVADRNRYAAALRRNRQYRQPQDLPALENELALFG